MRTFNTFISTILCLLLAAKAQESAQVPLSGISSIDETNAKVLTYQRESLAEAVAFTKHLMRTSTTGSIATTFPNTSEQAGFAIPSLDFHAPCHSLPSLTFLLLPISLAVRNMFSGSPVLEDGTKSGKVGYMIREEYDWEKDGFGLDLESGRGRRDDKVEEGEFRGEGSGTGAKYREEKELLILAKNRRRKRREKKDRGGMDHTRVSLLGTMHLLSPSDPDNASNSNLSTCFTAHHPSSSSWLPNAPDSPHISRWARFDVERAYYVGGFGDEWYIGWLDGSLLSD